MYRRHGNKLRWAFMLCDLAVTAVVWLGAYFLRFSFWPSPDGVPDTHLVLNALPLVLVAAAVAYHWAGLYEIHRLKPLPREIGVVCRAGGLLFLLSITVAFYRRDLYESRLALALFLVLNAVGLTLARRAVWLAVRYPAKPRNELRPGADRRHGPPGAAAGRNAPRQRLDRPGTRRFRRRRRQGRADALPLAGHARRVGTRSWPNTTSTTYSSPCRLGDTASCPGSIEPCPTCWPRCNSCRTFPAWRA